MDGACALMKEIVVSFSISNQELILFSFNHCHYYIPTVNTTVAHLHHYCLQDGLEDLCFNYFLYFQSIKNYILILSCI